MSTLNIKGRFLYCVCPVVNLALVLDKDVRHDAEWDHFGRW